MIKGLCFNSRGLTQRSGLGYQSLDASPVSTDSSRQARKARKPLSGLLKKIGGLCSKTSRAFCPRVNKPLTPLNSPIVDDRAKSGSSWNAKIVVEAPVLSRTTPGASQRLTQNTDNSFSDEDVLRFKDEDPPSILDLASVDSVIVDQLQKQASSNVSEMVQQFNSCDMLESTCSLMREGAVEISKSLFPVLSQTAARLSSAVLDEPPRDSRQTPVHEEVEVVALKGIEKNFNNRLKTNKSAQDAPLHELKQDRHVRFGGGATYYEVPKIYDEENKDRCFKPKKEIKSDRREIDAIKRSNDPERRRRANAYSRGEVHQFYDWPENTKDQPLDKLISQWPKEKNLGQTIGHEPKGSFQPLPVFFKLPPELTRTTENLLTKGHEWSRILIDADDEMSSLAESSVSTESSESSLYWPDWLPLD